MLVLSTEKIGSANFKKSSKNFVIYFNPVDVFIRIFILYQTSHLVLCLKMILRAKHTFRTHYLI